MDAEMTAIDKLFLVRIETITSGYRARPTALFFLGLSARQARLLASTPYAASSLKAVAASGEELQPAALAAKRRAAFVDLPDSNEAVAFLYEQLIDLKGTIKELFEGDIVIVCNNLFLDTEGYPSPLSKASLGQLVSSLDEMAESAESGSAISYYASCTRIGDNDYLVMPKRVEDELECAVVDLFEPQEPVSGSGKGLHGVRVPSSAYLAYRLALCDGVAEPTLFQTEGKDVPSLRVVASVLSACGCAYDVSAESQEDQKSAADADLLLPVLRRYWGRNARFRDLKFYKDPDVDNEMELVSQGQVAGYVARQAEVALSGDDSFSNVFMTAPTGAGKSLLFQLPALYLAERHNAVTLIIEPLKALMQDQVQNLRSRGVTCVAAINSDISFDERTTAYEGIRTGKISLVYLSPELLLSSSVDTILNGRRLGLVVIDEVHTVTSWGKDFRPDYWYLGPFLTKLRRAGMLFPTFCLTATAVYGGKDDVVNQSIRDLELDNCRVYLGNPRRDDIDFDIKVREKPAHSGPIEEVKTEFALKWIDRAVSRNEHAIVYCPYRKQVDHIVDGMEHATSKVLGFHARHDKEYKKIVTDAFKRGSCRVLVSTKAFGMGVDIDDISAVYHYAPTGNLADYIQEIGRGARKTDLRATASIDYFANDSRYARQLYGMSRFYQWQLREVMGKLYALYASRPTGQRHQNLLVSPDSFSYLFGDEKDETAKANRVKSALMMISRDLEERYRFPVIIVRPKTSYAKQYVCLNNEAEESFRAAYGSYLECVGRGTTRYEDPAGQSTVKISDMGSIYVLDLERMWEERFHESTFAKFKHDLFAGEVGGVDGAPAVTSRLVLTITYKQDFSTVQGQLDAYLTALSEALRKLMYEGEFTSKEFEAEFVRELGASAPALRHPTSLLANLVKPVDSANSRPVASALKCVTRYSRDKSDYGGFSNPVYTVNGKELIGFASTARQTLQKLHPDHERECVRYLNSAALGERYALAELLQTLDLASYEVRGGDNPEIFIRLNDPQKVKDLSGDQRYSNGVLKEMDERHEYSARVINRFFLTKLDDEERWDLVEEYFLGNDDYVSQKLGISDGGEGTARKVRYRGSKKLLLGLTATLDAASVPLEQQPFFRVWRLAEARCSNSRELADLKVLKELTRGARFAMPHLEPTVTIESSGVTLHPLFAWEEQRVLLFSLSRTGDFERAQGINWKSYLLGQGEAVKGLVEDIRLGGGAS